MPLHQKSNKPSHSVSVPDAIILCGGLGTRLRPVVSDRPKVLADINGTAFIDILLSQLKTFGFSRIILSIGYQGALVKAHMEKSEASVLFSEESEPLGTGGAVKKAWPLVRTDTCVVMNGDTFCNVDLRDFTHFHELRKTPLSMVVTKSFRSDGGGIVLTDAHRITEFREKESGKGTYLNAGVYALRKDCISFMPAQSAFSLEHDFFPSLIAKEPCFGYVTEEEAIDIGTPERYHGAISNLQTKR